ncbi:hypothetical protein CLU88_3695 [Acidovorax sp. 56]|uniref:cell surface protein n=1 Tax=Acidovorax sp. 56 TaxID=2035205 RepID=UPI000C16D60E|nr:cell surface protein [Acidovorax sp. 56]PIF28779.1 hypothetical protein CLU88_3695 [Acidovorax sp. 56]
MRKNVLALSIAAMIGGLGFAGVASADVVAGNGTFIPGTSMDTTTATSLQVSQGGIGHSLIVPYFNAQNGNMTVLHVVNTDTANGKAVKVRFRGALNSDDILDFQVFMSPGDVWTAAVSAGSDGVATLTTGDGTCTLPTLAKGVAQAFVQDRLNSVLTAADKANNTREGYVEIFNMADIPANTATTSLYTAIKHVNGVAPCTASVLNNTLQNFTTQAAASTAGFNTPTTGLYGDWYIINVAQTTTFSGGATAITALTPTGVAGRGNFVHFPQNANANAAPMLASADPLFRTDSRDAAGVQVSGAKIAAANYDLPDLSTPYTVGTLNAAAPLAQATNLTNAIKVTSITNQYANDASISAKTDWVFSMPTRRYNVAANYAATSNGAFSTAASDYRLFSDLAAVGFGDEMFTAANTTALATNGAICVNADAQTFYDREETTKTSGAVFSPGTVSATRFCGETSVLSFADSGVSVLGGAVARQNVSGVYTNGWAVLSTNNSGKGLPILGSSFIKLSNPSATANTSGTYGITWDHRFTR